MIELEAYGDGIGSRRKACQKTRIRVSKKECFTFSSSPLVKQRRNKGVEHKSSIGGGTTLLFSGRLGAHTMIAGGQSLHYSRAKRRKKTRKKGDD